MIPLQLISSTAALVAASVVPLGGPRTTVYGDAGRPDPAFAPFGVEAFRQILSVCMNNADGHLPFTRDNATALASVGVERVEFPPEYKIRSVSIQGGRLDYAQVGSIAIRDGRLEYQVKNSGGQLFFAAIPSAKLCETDVFDAPTRGRIFISLDAALRDNGWRLRARNDGLDVIRRVYEHLVPGRSPDEVLNLTEFVYGGGVTRHLRLSAVLKSYR